MFRSTILCLLVCAGSVAACAADKGAVLLKDLKAQKYDFFLKTDNAAYRSIKLMGYGSAYYVGLHLKRAGYADAARFYFTIGEKLYKAPLNRLCRKELYETGNPADRLKSIENRLQELSKTSNTAGQSGKAQSEQERLTHLKTQLLLKTGAYSEITQSPETLYLSSPLTAELAEAFPQFGKDIPPFLHKLAEARVSVFEKRYTEAWAAVQAAFDMQYTIADCAFQYLLSDIGKAGIYGAENAADAAAFFKGFVARVKDAAVRKQLSSTDAQRCLFYALFYEARCRVKIGGIEQQEQALTLFLQAAAQAHTDSGVDSALWYYLDTLRQRSRPRYLNALIDTAPRWKNPAWYADLVQVLRAQLTAEKDWKNLAILYEALKKTKMPEQRAAVAYTLTRTGSLSPDRTACLLQETAGESHNGLYYRILAAYRLQGTQLSEDFFQFNSPSIPTQSGGRTQTDGVQTQSVGQTPSGEFSPQEAQSYISGLLHFALYDIVYPQIAAVYPLIPVEEALLVARTLSDEGRYADSIRLMDLSLKNQRSTATRAQLEVLYPRPWYDIVSKYAAEYRLPEYLLYALIRSESFFQHRIVSGAGAVGLTQLMPATASDIARKLKISDYSLTDPEVNIRFGAYYLAEMLRRSDNRIMSACFAYNAGISRVRGWQKKAQGLPDDLFLESLEYAETRDYGRKIFAAAAIYGTLYYSEKPEDIVLLFFPDAPRH